MKFFNIQFFLAIILCLVLGFSIIGYGCDDDDDDDDDDNDDDDNDNAPAGNSDCDLACYATGVEESLLCEGDYYSCLTICAPTDAACQGICGDDWDNCAAIAEGTVRDCAENCAGCLLTYHNCFDTSNNDFDICWNGCSGNVTCQNNCNTQFGVDLEACLTAIDTCYSWFNKTCQSKAVDDWNTCALNCDKITDYFEKWSCYRLCTDTQATDTKKCIGL